MQSIKFGSGSEVVFTNLVEVYLVYVFVREFAQYLQGYCPDED